MYLYCKHICNSYLFTRYNVIFITIYLLLLLLLLLFILLLLLSSSLARYQTLAAASHTRTSSSKLKGLFSWFSRYLSLHLPPWLLLWDQLLSTENIWRGNRTGENVLSSTESNNEIELLYETQGASGLCTSIIWQGLQRLYYY